jgi:type 1 glutamine amidotransferase
MQRGGDSERCDHAGTIVPMKRAFSLLATCLALSAPVAASAAAAPPHILVFTKTTGFRHASIPVAIQAVRDLGAHNGFAVDATEDSSDFTDANLKRYDAIVFLMTTGDVLSDVQQTAFQRFIRAGGGWVGVHSAADTEYDWPWYGDLVGAYFKDHPTIQSAVLDVADPRDRSTSGLPAKWMRTDEWYNFQSNPRSAVHVLATIEESSYDGGEMGADHPIAWWHDYDGGRAWYTAGGHTDEAWSEPLFLAHILGGVEYAIGKPVQPEIVSLTATVHARRVAVTARYTNCPACTAQLRVGTATTTLRTVGGVASGRSRVLPLGRARVYVVLTDAAAGVKLTASRPIVVR